MAQGFAQPLVQTSGPFSGVASGACGETCRVSRCFSAMHYGADLRNHSPGVGNLLPPCLCYSVCLTVARGVKK